MGLWYLNYDGKAWEGLCDVLLARKHEADYQPMGDKGGDLGLDGLYARGGTIYQAYGQEPENKDPVGGVRSKIGADLNKLKKNKDEIEEILGDTKIKSWVLLLNKDIPHNHLHRYAKKKEIEVKSWQLPFIASDFQVIIQPPSFLETEWLEYRKRRDDKVEVPISKPQAPEIELLKGNENFRKVYAKFLAIYDAPETAERMAYVELKNFIENSIQLDEIRKREPEFYSEIEEIRSDIEMDAESGSLAVGSYETYSGIKTTLEQRLNAVVGGRLGERTLSGVRKFTIADWLVRCPLNFKKKPLQ
ncbi:hypothetical protein HFO61_05915 [Rhizobium leguminosarum]|uniref:hypothetical protein n=1 Tax=Rhizobium leguminosarum TaxID=384 RepID=UPI001C9413C9|nr:hypothetical protein [Rhizobium leguminosarum]MBY5546366.1 hypothetical protein [Rhizobium leguminosarum]